MKAKFEGHCRLCGTTIVAGSEISRHQDPNAESEFLTRAAWVHSNCVPSQDPEADQEYWKGRHEGHTYSQNIKIYGSELANAWEMEAEMARYNRGEDY